jgi:hypothetical protein
MMFKVNEEWMKHFIVTGKAEEHIKKPIPVYAVQIDEPFEVETLEGTMRAKKGDYLIQGVRGELYPCDKEIFEQTYELVK